MSNFDEWFKKKFKDLHEAICCGDLVANNYRKAIKKGFEAGTASRQAEIDALKEEVMREREQGSEFFVDCENMKVERDALKALGEMSEQKIDDLVLRNIELQKRVDGALGLLKGTSIGEVYKAIRVLRGEQADASE